MKKKALLFDGRDFPSPATGSGSSRASSPAKAGRQEDLVPGKSSTFFILSLSDVEKNYKKFIYPDTDGKMFEQSGCVSHECGGNSMKVVRNGSLLMCPLHYFEGQFRLGDWSCL